MTSTATAQYRTTPRVLNKHTHGIPEGAVYIGRGSPWGNRFVIGRDGTRDEVCDKYEAWLAAQPGLLARLPSLQDGRPPPGLDGVSGRARADSVGWPRRASTPPLRGAAHGAAPARALWQGRAAPGAGPKRPAPGAAQPRQGACLRC